MQHEACQRNCTVLNFCLTADSDHAGYAFKFLCRLIASSTSDDSYGCFHARPSYSEAHVFIGHRSLPRSSYQYKQVIQARFRKV